MEDNGRVWWRGGECGLAGGPCLSLAEWHCYCRTEPEWADSWASTTVSHRQGETTEGLSLLGWSSISSTFLTSPKPVLPAGRLMRKGLAEGNPVVNSANSLCRFNPGCSRPQVLACQDGPNAGSKGAWIFFVGSYWWGQTIVSLLYNFIQSFQARPEWKYYFWEKRSANISWTGMEHSLKAFKYFPPFMTVSANFFILKDTEKLGYAFNKVHVWVISRHTAISLFETILINFTLK